MKWQDLPPGVLYPLLIPHVVKLCIRYRAPLSIIAKSNPAFPDGGLPFAPKNKMFDLFSGILPYTLIKKNWNLKKRVKLAESFAKKAKFPLITKPNAGHRGIDVKLISNKNELQSLLKSQKWDYLLQEYCDYPLEFGIFYCQIPGKAPEIVSTTQKIIPVLTGNGKDTVNNLINKANIENKETIRKRHADKLNTILARGKKLKTLVTASHCQGAIFSDAKKVLTKELTKKVFKLCEVPGFYFGRFDVMAKSIEDFKKGKFKIIEINGATSEFIHVYDKNFSFKQGISDLKRQWNLLFEVSHKNRDRKENSLSFGKFIKKYIDFFSLTKKVTGKPW